MKKTAQNIVALFFSYWSLHEDIEVTTRMFA